jgi:sugar lactone lactonase YvrE
MRSFFRWIKRLFLAVLLIILAAAVYLFSPGDVDPVAYQPPSAPPMAGPYAPNEELRKADLLALGAIRGPEDIAVDAQGRIYSGLEDGTIIRLRPDGSPEKWASIDGRPLGLKFDSSGNLIVCNGYGSLISVSPDGKSTVLTTVAPDGPLAFVDDLDIAPDGVIYFTDASNKFTYGEDRRDLLETQGRGRLLSFDPQTGKTTTLLRNLYFANGVALAPDSSYVLVNETWDYSVRKYWLKGPLAGRDSRFLQNLPGFPDNINSNGRGTFWIALFTVRNPDMDRLHPWPFAKFAMSKLPQALLPQPRPYGFVLGVDESGRVTHNLQDPTGSHLKEITSALEYDGSLYLGSLHADRIGRYRLKMPIK